MLSPTSLNLRKYAFVGPLKPRDYINGRRRTSLCLKINFNAIMDCRGCCTLKLEEVGSVARRWSEKAEIEVQGQEI